MKSSFRIIIAIAVAMLCFTAGASAEWRIKIDSISVAAGGTAKLDFFGYWDLGLTALTVPLVVKEINPGAFWTDSLPHDRGGNAAFKPDSHFVEWKWGTWAFIVEEIRPADTGYYYNEPCPEGREIDSLYDGVSPDNFVVNVASGGKNFFSPATDSTVFLTLTFVVTDVGGVFEFDTACFSSSLVTIFMIDNVFPPVNHGPSGTGEATFQKGIVYIEKDTDEDGVNDDVDNCWLVPNPGQEDADEDKVGDACDNCQVDYNPDQENSDSSSSDMFDEYGDSCDNCPLVVNPEQADSNDDGIGDACDDPNAILEIEDAVPADYALLQNYPNPFNANTLIEFVLYQGGHVKLEVFDILGQKVTTLVEGNLPPGRHTATWKGKNAKGKSVSSGLYFYRLTASEFTEMKKMVLMK